MFLFLLLIFIAKRYFKTLVSKWEKSEIIINEKNLAILNLDEEKIKLKAQNQQLNDKLDQAEKIVTQLEQQQVQYEQEKQSLDTELKAIQFQIAQEKDSVHNQIKQLNHEKQKALEELSLKYEHNLNHELKRKTDEINKAYTEELIALKNESQSKLMVLDNSLVETQQIRDELSLKNEKLLQDLEVANELMNGVSDDLEKTKTHRDELQVELNRLQKLVNEEKQNQSNLMSKDVKKWIAYYLLSNPIFSAKTRHTKPKYNPNNHHGGEYVKQLYDLIAKNKDIAQFVTDVKSVNNSPYKKTIVITRVKQKGINDTSYGYIAEVSSDDDRGSCAGVFLTARTEWEAIVQAKLLIIHITSTLYYC